MSLGQKIKELRESKDIPQGKLAEKVGITGAMMSFIESGEKIPSLAVAKRIAKELGVSLDYLVDNENC